MEAQNEIRDLDTALDYLDNGFDDMDKDVHARCLHELLALDAMGEPMSAALVEDLVLSAIAEKRRRAKGDPGKNADDADDESDPFDPWGDD